MTQFSDGLRLGAAGSELDTRAVPTKTFIGGGIQGVPISPTRMYSGVPVTGTLAAAQTITSAQMTLTSLGGIVTTTTAVNGSTLYDLGMARTIVFTGQQTTVTAALLYISGYDPYLQALTQTITGPTGTGTAETLKTFRYVAGIYGSGNTVSAISAAVGDKMGLPYCVTSVDFVWMSWAGQKIVSSAGFSGAVTTVPSTSLLGDVRGVYTLSSASDGVKRFTAHITVNDPDTTNNAYGVPQV